MAKEVPLRPISKASSLSPELTLRSQRTNNRDIMKQNSNGSTSMVLYGLKHISSDLPAKKPDNPDVPEESSARLTEDIFTGKESLSSWSNQVPIERPLQKDAHLFSFKGSQASTPRMKASIPLVRPTR